MGNIVVLMAVWYREQMTDIMRTLRSIKWEILLTLRVEDYNRPPEG